ncbi:serine hydrolase domain-containing protein [uncultured Algimonas sp.]|uniref:serine hydrolase domain-containing protein n=1 Tax=uncultured Algimonas sp. TaxID=1547920 RepID=UPI0026199421|nr:serine hydrolase domain-containing protein [uncultured Algimonas sp.]
MSPLPPLSGLIAPGFESVRDAVIENFADGDELGCQVAIFRRGDPVVDLCAGWSDRARKTEVAPETLFSVYSSGKAMAALVIAHLVEQGRLDYDRPVADIWPEFAAHGKAALTLAQMMSHQSGLVGITDPDFQPEDWIDFDKVVAILEDQEPLFEPGSQSGYHPVTFGFLAGEVARRADPQSRRLGRILAEDLAEPANGGAGADVHIGIDPADNARVAQLVKPRAMADLGPLTDAKRVAFLKPWSSPARVSGDVWREAELAGSNCQATAAGIGALMEAFATGSAGGRKVLSEDVRAAATISRTRGPNAVLPFTIDFAAGVMRNAPNFAYGPHPGTLGHSGWGGSAVFADPDTGLHGAYVMNRQREYLMGDPRANRVIAAAFDALDEKAES